MVRHLVLLLLIVASVFGAACDGDDTSSSGDGGVDVVATLSDALKTADVDTVTVTVSRENPSHQVITARLVKTLGQWQTTIGHVPIGSGATAWKIAGEASKSSDPGHVLFRGEIAGVEVSPSLLALVALTLQRVDAPAPFENAAPIVDALFVSAARVFPGDTVRLAATAHDPNSGDVLTSAWTDSGPGANDFSAPDQLTTTWTAPSVGSYALSLAVRDPKGLTTGVSVTIAVVDRGGAATGDVAVDAKFNTWPGVDAMTASPTLVAPAGGDVDLHVTASDNDGDALTYAWTSDCAGTFSAAAESTTWSMAPRAAGDCVLTATVTDARGGTNHGSFTLHVGTPPAVQHP